MSTHLFFVKEKCILEIKFRWELVLAGNHWDNLGILSRGNLLTNQTVEAVPKVYGANQNLALGCGLYSSLCWDTNFSAFYFHHCGKYYREHASHFFLFMYPVGFKG